LAVVLARVVDHGTRLCRADTVALEILEPETGLLSLAAMSGAPLPAPAAVPIAPAATFAGRAMAAGTAIELGGEEAQRQSTRYADAAVEPFRTCLAVPLVTEGSAGGALVFCRGDGGPFEATAVRRAQELARWAALAIRNAWRHAEQRRELTALREGQPRLVQAEKQAALTTLAAGAAHEINNP